MVSEVVKKVVHHIGVVRFLLQLPLQRSEFLIGHGERLLCIGRYTTLCADFLSTNC
jgi:hypothetical protein